MLYVRRRKLPYLVTSGRHVFNLAYPLLLLSVLEIMNTLPTLKKIRGLHMNPVKCLLKNWEGVPAVGPASLVVLGEAPVVAGSVSFTKRHESFVVLWLWPCLFHSAQFTLWPHLLSSWRWGHLALGMVSRKCLPGLISLNERMECCEQYLHYIRFGLLSEKHPPWAFLVLSFLMCQEKLLI